MHASRYQVPVTAVSQLHPGDLVLTTTPVEVIVERDRPAHRWYDVGLDPWDADPEPSDDEHHLADQRRNDEAEARE